MNTILKNRKHFQPKAEEIKTEASEEAPSELISQPQQPQQQPQQFQISTAGAVAPLVSCVTVSSLPPTVGLFAIATSDAPSLILAATADLVTTSVADGGGSGSVDNSQIPTPVLESVNGAATATPVATTSSPPSSSSSSSPLTLTTLQPVVDTTVEAPSVSVASDLVAASPVIRRPLLVQVNPPVWTTSIRGE